MAKKIETNNFKDKLWEACNKLRNNMDSSKYKYVVLGLVFLKYISDKFEERYEELVKEGESFEEDIDAYKAKNIFWVPKEARWSNIVKLAKRPDIGNLIDEAMTKIESEPSNKRLKGVLFKVYSDPGLDKAKLGELIDIIESMNLVTKDTANHDILGQVYEFFLGKFAKSEGHNGGQFYTPSSVVKIIVEALEPLSGRVYDPACGSGGMFVQSEKFIKSHRGNINNVSIFGQESNDTTWKLCKMNLAIRGLDVNLGNEPADSFLRDQHKVPKMDFVMANPPFNVKDYWQESLKGDERWQYGVPPTGNANYAWMQHMVHHLSANGVAGIVMANGALSSNTSEEGNIRKRMLEADIIDCIIALPDRLFLTTGIPACIWIFNKNKKNISHREHSGETLFIDARKMGYMVDRKLRELSDEDINLIASTYHKWRGSDKSGMGYKDMEGFCKNANLDEIKGHEYVLTPGRYVGLEESEDDELEYEAKMSKLSEVLVEQFKKSHELEEEIKKNLASIGIEI